MGKDGREMGKDGMEEVRKGYGGKDSLPAQSAGPLPLIKGDSFFSRGGRGGSDSRTGMTDWR